MIKSIPLLIFLSVVAAPVAWATSMPAQLPAYGQDKPLPVPRIEKKTLVNGLQVWVVPREGLPRVDYLFAVRGAGLSADEADAPGFAELMVDMFDEGTARRDSKAIAEAAQGYGGGLDASAGIDGVIISGNALASHAEPMLRLVAEVVRSPAFPNKEVQLAKANALQELKAAEAQPKFRAERALGVAVYGEHPYSRTQPTEASIAAVTSERLQAEHARRIRPDRGLLVITGRIGVDEAFRVAEAAFGDWVVEASAPAVIASAPRQAKPARILLERAGSVQSTLRLGRPAVPASDPDYVPLRLANSVLGSGFSSRLMQNLREDKGYTYGASSDYRANLVGGSLIGQADVRNEVTDKALKEFFDEYAKLGNELVPAKEMEMTKRYIAGGYMLTNQMQASVASTLAGNWLVGLPSEFLGEFVPKIRSVSAEQVMEMGKKYFAPETQSIVVVGDPAAVAEQLKAYGEFVVSGK